MPKSAIIVHGGAWAIPDDRVAPSRLAAERAREAGWAVLTAGGGALDAICAAIATMEDDPVFNAGTGSSLNAEGEVEMDAALMSGRDREAGAVAAIRGVAHPIEVARLVMEESPHVLLVAEGARRFALGHGAAMSDALVIEEQRKELESLYGEGGYATWKPFAQGPGDTVGAVVVDASGLVVAGTSTGGTPGKAPGRVGDSPLIGAGTYAEIGGGASATGWGESIIRGVLAFRAVEAMADGLSPTSAAEQALAALDGLPHALAGLILANAEGQIGFGFTTPRMAYAFRDADGAVGSGPD